MGCALGGLTHGESLKGLVTAPHPASALQGASEVDSRDSLRRAVSVQPLLQRAMRCLARCPPPVQ